MTSAVIGILLALAAAGAWGAGDFLGGFATRRNSALLVLGLVSATGLVVALVMVGLTGEGWLAWTDAGWAAAAGIMGGLGLVALYRGLALGAEAGAGAAMVSPTAAVVGAVVPVLVGMLNEGLPKTVQLAGFAAGIAGIWLVTRPQTTEIEISDGREGSKSGYRKGIELAVLAGLGFGGFFVFLAQVQEGHVFGALAVTKVVEGLLAVGAIWLGRVYPERFPAVLPADGKINGLGLAIGAGVLDAAGNVLYMLAAASTRLDMAAVLVSMYPVGTVLLAGAVMKEGVGKAQWVGVGLCMLGVGLIAV